MGLITSSDRLRDPENILFDIHDLKGQTGYRSESKKEFRIKVFYIVVVVVVMMLALMQQMPGIIDVMILVVAGLLVAEISFTGVRFFNYILRRRSRAAMLVLCLMVIIVILVGA